MKYNLPILDYLLKVLEEHTIPLKDPGSGLINAVWLVDMVNEVEATYRKYDSI
jgi:hypothetical protein